MKNGNEIELATNSPNDSRLSKKWGYLSALPSEYLIHFRDGKINETTSGQGGSCFKKLNDTVFIIPTSLKEIIFTAEQLSQDNVLITIKGSAIYKISNPLQMYKLINFSDRERSEAKLAQMIGTMCRSTAKSQIANMFMEQCLRGSKSEIAASLVKEVSAVITQQGTEWGVQIITININDVYIQDPEIFKCIQNLYRSDTLRSSEFARMEVEKDIKLKKLEMETSVSKQELIMDIQKAEISAELHKKQMEMEVERLNNELEVIAYSEKKELSKIRSESAIKEEKAALQFKVEQAQFAIEKAKAIQNDEIEKMQLLEQLERERHNILFNAEKSDKELESKKAIHEEESKALQMRLEAESTMSPLMLEKYFIESALPAIAEAMAKSMNDVKINVFGNTTEGGFSPFFMVLNELMSMLNGFKK